MDTTIGIFYFIGNVTKSVFFPDNIGQQVGEGWVKKDKCKGAYPGFAVHIVFYGLVQIWKYLQGGEQRQWSW